MDLHLLAQPLSHAIAAIALDENTVSVLAMLAGIAGGWTITASLRPKTKKVEVERKDDSGPRKPE